MKHTFTILLFAIFSLNGFSQGLESIIVERYYVSNSDDKVDDAVGGVLPINSVTYRVYVDLKPDYIFQVAYGLPNHPLKIGTTTKFFNNVQFGSVSSEINDFFLNFGTVMLDSWLSVGGASVGNFGILKESDDGMGTITNQLGILANDDSFAGIPLTEQDGLIAGTPEPFFSIGMDEQIKYFEANTFPEPQEVFIDGGSWAAVNGATGADPEENRILIGQFTTDGTFYFELNIQIRNEITLEVENYVARNPIDAEIEFPELIYRDSLDIMSSIDNQLVKANLMEVYPNPANDEVHLVLPIELSPKANFSLNDINGKVVRSGSLNKTHNIIDLNDLNSGVYLIIVNSEKVTLTRKIIIQ